MTAFDDIRAGGGYIGLSSGERSASGLAAGLVLALAGAATWQLFLVMPTLPRSAASALKLFSVSPPALQSEVPPRLPLSTPTPVAATVAPARRMPQPTKQSAAVEPMEKPAAPPRPVVSMPVPVPVGLAEAADVGDDAGMLDDAVDTIVGQGVGGQDRDARLDRADWIQRPTPADVKREWPRGKRLPAGPVAVELACAVRPDGHPTHCRVAHESPPGYGFGAAAARMAQRAIVRPRMTHGMPSDRRVVIPLAFTVR